MKESRRFISRGICKILHFLHCFPSFLHFQHSSPSFLYFLHSSLISAFLTLNSAQKGTYSHAAQKNNFFVVILVSVYLESFALASIIYSGLLAFNLFNVMYRLTHITKCPGAFSIPDCSQSKLLGRIGSNFAW